MPRFTTPAGVAVHWETDGDPAGAPLVLVHGGGAQLIGWDDGFVALLVAAGFHVVRPDNRDAGLSQQTGGPDDTAAGYDLGDMADDVVALLDHLGIARAHLAGMSMGGYIVQLVALARPERVASLALMSTSASSAPEFLVADHGVPTPVTTPAVPLDRDAYLTMFVGGQRALASPAHPFDEEGSRALAGRCYDRVHRPDGLVRQWNAMLRGPLERREAVRGITAPTVVLHGRDDQVLRPAAALTLAGLIPGAELHLYAGMGHDVPRPLWPDLVTAIARTAARAT